MFATENEQSKTYRPDRLVETENGIIIVDFKTGEEKTKTKSKLKFIKISWSSLEKVIKTDVIYI
jgi:hypothetical protein